MPNFYTPNTVAIVEGVLAADVANSGTFTVAYPTGFTQDSFTAGLHGAGSYLMVNGNDKLTVAASKISLAFGASLITVTNSSGATLPAGTKFILNVDQADGNDVLFLTLPITLAAITGAGDVVTEIRPGVDGVIENVEFVVTSPVTTAAKAATLNLEIGTTDVTGGTIALTSAAATPLGKVITSAAAPSAGNTLTKASKLSVEASSVTAFAEGTGYLVIRIRKT
jgi:hypothetical protein